MQNPKRCECGCEGFVSVGKKFLRGHYIRTKKALERLDMIKIPEDIVKPKSDIYDIHGVGFATDNKLETNIIDMEFKDGDPKIEEPVDLKMVPPNTRTINCVAISCSKCHFFGYVHVLVAQTGVCPKCQKRI